MTCHVVYERALPAAQIKRDEFDPLRAIVWLNGEIDAPPATALAADLATLRADGRRVVRIDTYGVSFLNSTALDVLLDAHRRWLAMRGTLVLINVTGPTARMLELTGLDRELLCMPPAADVEANPVGLVAVN